MLAAERAKQPAEAGRSVLFVCFKKSFATHMKQTVARHGIEFSTFTGYMRHSRGGRGWSCQSIRASRPPSSGTSNSPLARDHCGCCADSGLCGLRELAGRRPCGVVAGGALESFADCVGDVEGESRRDGVADLAVAGALAAREVPAGREGL
jgi:hypothetical protein